MSPSSPAGQKAHLLGEAKRQATDSILGYDYQIWRTVEAWMLLNPSDILYIECAEDYDIASDAGVLMAQVKNSPKAITLNSADVKDAIQNFWTARRKNPNRGKLSLRFLTRGEIGHERDREFGEEKGLELWCSAAAGDASAARRLATYLQKTLSDASLGAFLKTSQDGQLIEELFGRVEWVTGESGIDAVQLAVQRMAIQRGAQDRITAQASAKAVASLLASCREVAVRKEPQARSLTLEDFQLVFEQSTTLPVPITNNIQATLNALLSPGTGRTSFLASAVSNELPPLEQPHLPRADFIATVASGLLDSPAVLIVGSEGRGKTTVASILGHQVSGKVRWVDLTAYPDEPSIATALEDTLIAARGAEPPKCVILDNVPVAQGMTDHIWTIIRALIQSCRQAKAVLLLTAKGVSDDAVDSRFRAAQIKVLSAPALTQPEVEQFFAELGCPTEKTTHWAKISLMQSGNGHPKLVYLHGLELRDNGWPAITGDAIVVAPTSIEEARAHARLVASKVVNDTDRPFLYALSMAMIPFDRAVALGVGAGLSIAAPGESFDRLAGRWIEHRGGARYSVTSMLNGQAQKIWAEEKVCEANRVLFDAFIGKRTIRVDEAWGVFLHAFAGKEPKRVAGFLKNLLSEDFDQVPQLAEALEVLVLMGSDGLKFAIPFDRRCSVLLRIIQFKIAKVCRRDKLASIAESWGWEIEQILDEEEKEEAKIIRGLSIVCCMDGDLPPSLVIGALRDASRYQELQLAFDIPTPPPISGMDENVPVLAWLFSWAQTRCDSAEILFQFLDALEALDSPIRSQMLQAFDGPYARTGISMVESAWIGELNRESQDWPALICVLEKAQYLAKKWECEQLRAAAVKTLSIIYDEHLGDSEKALETLRASDLRGRSMILKDQEANVLFRRDDFEAALGLWREALNAGVDGMDASLRWHDRFSMRKAAIAAGKLGGFEEAAKWLQRGAAEARRMPAGVPAAAFELDAAYCWFKHGDGHMMVESLTAAAAALKGDYDRQTEFFQFAAQKNLGNTALWLQGYFLGDNTRGTEPLVGSSSNPDIDRAGYQTLPVAPPAIAAFMILDLAHKVGVETSALRELAFDLEASNNAIAGFQFGMLKLERTMESGKLSAMADCAYGLQVAIWRSTEANKAESGITAEFSADMDVANLPLSSADITWLFLTALALRTIIKGSPQSLVNEWDTDLRDRPRAEDFKAIITGLVPNFAVSAATAYSVMRARPPTYANIGAAAKFLASDQRNPSDTLYAQVALLIWFQDSPAKVAFDYSLEAFYAAFSNQWRQHISTPALLVNPRMTIPMLESAIISEAPTAKRMLNLLLAGCAACRARIPPELVIGLEKSSSQRSALDSFLARKP
jgi:tetratricopeptide (TPR) repeat protein